MKNRPNKIEQMAKIFGHGNQKPWLKLQNSGKKETVFLMTGLNLEGVHWVLLKHIATWEFAVQPKVQQDRLICM